MIRKIVKVINEQGLHMRPAGMISKVASSFKFCDIHLEYDGIIVNAKSVMSIMLSNIKKDEYIEIVCDGEGELIAMEELMELFDENFDE